MGKLVFIPFSVAAGLLAGLVSKKAFEAVWGVIDDQEPPAPEHREVSWPRMLAAAAIEGAAFSSTRAATDHGARIAYARLTGRWPGEEEPEAK
ncbi:MAG: DUF4235 domain-containing protein [Solirubrobacterales bacterium]